MKKNFIKVIATMIISVCILSACEVGGNEKQTVKKGKVHANAKFSEVSTVDENSPYNNILSYKTDDYSTVSISSFYHSILPKDENLSQLLADYTNVIDSITEDDENYEFIKYSFGASLNELYCNQMGEIVSISDSVRKAADPLKPLNTKEEKEFSEDPAYGFMFTAFYSLQYNILQPENLTVGERDQALREFHSILETYVNDLNKKELMLSDTKKTIEEKAKEIAEKLSTEKIELICTIERIEVHNEGEDTQY